MSLTAPYLKYGDCSADFVLNPRGLKNRPLKPASDNGMSFSIPYNDKWNVGYGKWKPTTIVGPRVYRVAASAGLSRDSSRLKLLLYTLSCGRCNSIGCVTPHNFVYRAHKFYKPKSLHS